MSGTSNRRADPEPRPPLRERAIYEQFARVSKALASPHRIELVELLSQGPRTVAALARMTDMSVANTSQHLQVQGLFVTYRLADRSVAISCRARGRGRAARGFKAVRLDDGVLDWAARGLEVEPKPER